MNLSSFIGLRIRLTVVAAVAVLGLCLIIWFSGCEVKVNSSWSGFGAAASYHPFSDSLSVTHRAYLQSHMDHPDPLSECRVCHGQDYSGGTSEQSCLNEGCHTFTGGPDACNTCHGNFFEDPTQPANQAPPRDVAGNTSTESIGVGAHQTHLLGGPYTDGIPCNSCHVIPTSSRSQGHIKAGPAEVIFSELAVQSGADPVWNRSDRNCSDTYCHRPGVPVWTVVDGTQAACGDCHSIPPLTPAHQPPNPIPTLDECYECHSRVIDESGMIIDRQLHVDGDIEFQ
jgi:predicted CxxxxCH...CXXCH cytochrome family protein